MILSRRTRTLICFSTILATGVLTTGCGNSTSTAPLNLPTAPSQSARVIPQPTETTDPAFITTQVDPNAIQIDNGLDQYSTEDMKSAVGWTMNFIPVMYSYTGYWNTGSNANTFSPLAYWPFGSFMDQNYWNSTIMPMLASQETLEKNKATFTGLGPVPPKINGQWTSNAVSNFTYQDPTFQQVGSNLKVSLPYTAQAVYTEKSGTQVSRIPISHTVTLTLQKAGSDWKIMEWSMTPPTYGTSVSLSQLPPDRLPANPQTAPTSIAGAPVPITNAQIQNMNDINKQKYGDGSDIKKGPPPPFSTASPSPTPTPTTSPSPSSSATG